MFVAVIAALLALPGRMPPLSHEEYGAKTNHITSFDDNPPFKGIVVLKDLGCPDLHRNRIRRHFLDDSSGKLLTPLSEHEFPSITSTTSTENILKHIVNRFALFDAPVDAKEVAESIEFYLRSGKRAIGAARRVLKNKGVTEGQSMVVNDLCSGHGLTGMIFAACNPPGRLKASMRVLLVDQSEPQSHSILRNLISERCYGRSINYNLNSRLWITHGRCYSLRDRKPSRISLRHAMLLYWNSQGCTIRSSTNARCFVISRHQTFVFIPREWLPC